MNEVMTDAEKLSVIYELLNGVSSKDAADMIGLYEGDTGLLLFLYYYGYFKNDEQLVSYADELTQQIVNKIPLLREDSFQSGILGIGWALHHLSVMKFIDASGPFLNDWDHLCCNYIKNTNCSLKNGSLGYAVFLLGRLNNISISRGTIDEKLKEHNKVLSLIRYTDEIESILIAQYESLELVSITDIDNLFAIDLIHLHDFIFDLCNSLIYLNNVMDHSIYPAVVLRNIKRISSELVLALDTLLLKKSKAQQHDNDQVVVYMATVCNVVYSLIYTCAKKHTTIGVSNIYMLDELVVLHNYLNGSHPSYLQGISTFHNRTLQLLHKIKRYTGSTAVGDIHVEMKEKMFGYIQQENYSNKSLDFGLSGYGLSVLAGMVPEFDAWDQAIGLS
jgi:hypothetical protein